MNSALNLQNIHDLTRNPTRGREFFVCQINLHSAAVVSSGKAKVLFTPGLVNIISGNTANAYYYNPENERGFEHTEDGDFFLSDLRTGNVAMIWTNETDYLREYENFIDHFLVPEDHAEMMPDIDLINEGAEINIIGATPEEIVDTLRRMRDGAPAAEPVVETIPGHRDFIATQRWATLTPAAIDNLAIVGEIEATGEVYALGFGPDYFQSGRLNEVFDFFNTGDETNQTYALRDNEGNLFSLEARGEGDYAFVVADDDPNIRLFLFPADKYADGVVDLIQRNPEDASTEMFELADKLVRGEIVVETEQQPTQPEAEKAEILNDVALFLSGDSDLSHDELLEKIRRIS